MYLQGTNIHGGEFRVITNQTIQNSEFAFHSILNPQKLKSVGFNQVGIQALSQAISHGAMHESADQDPLLDATQAHTKRLSRTSYAGSKNQTKPPLFFGLTDMWGSGNQPSCRRLWNSALYISEDAFSLDEVHTDAT